MKNRLNDRDRAVLEKFCEFAWLVLLLLILLVVAHSGRAQTIYYPALDYPVWAVKASGLPSVFPVSLTTGDASPLNLNLVGDRFTVYFLAINDAGVTISDSVTMPRVQNTTQTFNAIRPGVRDGDFFAVQYNPGLKIECGFQDHPQVLRPPACVETIRSRGNDELCARNSHCTGATINGQRPELVWPSNLVRAAPVGGDVNADGTVSVADAFYLINFIFASGAPPIGNGDLNGDGAVSATDIIWLLSYLFR